MTEPSSVDIAGLPKAEFAFPGPLRDQLVAAILDGTKTSTTGLLVAYEQEGAALPEAGRRAVVVDSADQPVAVIEVTEIRLVRVGDIDLAHARDEGEGYRTLEQWRAVHDEFWHSAEFRAAMGDPDFTVDDDTIAVAERFQVVRRL